MKGVSREREMQRSQNLLECASPSNVSIDGTKLLLKNIITIQN